ncbi:hypothetical protein U27_02595 [Candidatus Vecturithrix granuli]|uniref:Uncharacterized protein n=1 Tax=Vecturithrix granuli TaxID=1499967 RepID=A0A081CB11_VECG1|nr:hypothetical protein U27_02595 [Candidatus Vecturithrix granuli]
MSFPAKYASKCANGHPIVVGEYIAFTDQGLILCVACPDFTTYHKHKETIYSNKFCKKCYMELSIAEKETGKEVCADCE